MQRYRYINFSLSFVKELFLDKSMFLAHILYYHLLNKALLNAKLSYDNGKVIHDCHDLAVAMFEIDQSLYSAMVAKAFPFYVQVYKEHYGITKGLLGEYSQMPPDLGYKYRVKGKAPKGTIPHLWNNFCTCFSVCVSQDEKRQPIIVGMSMQTFMALSRKKMTKFKKATLLMHLAIRSILGSEWYKPISDDLIIARMNGDTEPGGPLSDELEYYTQSDLFCQLLDVLQEKWHLACHYDADTDQDYYSYRLTHDELVARINSTKVNRAIAETHTEPAASISRPKAKRTIAQIHTSYRLTVKNALAAYNQQHPMPGKVKK